MKKNIIIETKNLTKTYKRFVKKEGLKGSIQGLFKREYEEKRAVNGIDLEIEEGEFLGLIGPNGAGTTTLKCFQNAVCSCYGAEKSAFYGVDG